MGKIINQKNAAGLHHGYWEQYYDGDKKHLWSKYHWFNGKAFGYYERFSKDGRVWYKCHYKNGMKIGCEQVNTYQYFYNKPGKKFGEQIKWK